MAWSLCGREAWRSVNATTFLLFDIILLLFYFPSLPFCFLPSYYSPSAENIEARFHSFD